MLWQIFRCQIGLHDFRCNLPCVYILPSLISIARDAFKFPRICFRRTNCEIFQEPVCLLAFEFYIARPGPAVISVCKYSRLILITDNISAFRTFFFGDATQWWRNALRNRIPCICKLFTSNKNLDVLSSTCFLL